MEEDYSKHADKSIYNKNSNISNTTYEIIPSPNRNDVMERSVDSKYASESQNMEYSNYSIISNDNDKSINYQLNLDDNPPTPNRQDISYTSSVKRSDRSLDLSNPALKVLNHSKFSNEVFKYLNAARSNPLMYAAKLEKILKEDVESGEMGCVLYINNHQIRLSEGENAFREAIRFLKKQKPMPIFKTKDGMRRSAEDLVNIINLNDGKGDIITEKLAEVNFRMNKYGIAVGELNEMIEYGTFDPEYVVISLIICDGDLSRKERQIIFGGTSNYVSVYSGMLPSDIIFTVVNLAEQYFEQGAILPEFIVEKYHINSKFIGKIDVPDMNAFKGCDDKGNTAGHNTHTIRTNKYNESTFNTKTNKSLKHDQLPSNIKGEYAMNTQTYRGESGIVEKNYQNESLVCTGDVYEDNLNARNLAQFEGNSKTIYGKALTKDKKEESVRDTLQDFKEKYPQYDNKKDARESEIAVTATYSGSKPLAKEKLMGPIESIRSVTNTKPKSVLSMLTRQFTSTTTSQKDKNNNLNIKSLKKQETPLSESQKLQNPAYNKTLSQTINLDNMPVYDSSPIVNLNINDGITEADFDEINITDSGKLINCNIQQSSITTKDSTNAVESKSTKIKQSDGSRGYLNTDNNMYESFKNNPSKGINSNFNTQSSLKNTIYTNNYNINALSQTIRVNNPSSNCNTNNSDDYNLKNTVYNSNPYMNNYNSSNYHSLKLSNNTAQNVKESRDENPNDLSKKRIITHEIRLSKDLDNFNSSLDLTKLKNFPENVKTIKIVEKVITNNNKNNSTENNTEDNSKMNDESEPYVKKKIVKKMIQFKDGSSEVVFYEK